MKRIAVIYEKQKAFLTVSGDYYRYCQGQNGLKCCKMSGEERKWLLIDLQLRRYDEDDLTVWKPVCREVSAAKEGEHMLVNASEREF